MEIIKIISLFLDVILFVVMGVTIYRLKKKVNELNERLNEKNAVFRISGNDLVGVLEKQNKTKIPTTKPEQRAKRP